MRAGEFTYNRATSPDHLRCNPQVVTVFLRLSKTDPFGATCHICLGHTNVLLCPVSAIFSYLPARPSGSGPLFIFQNGSPLSRPLLVSKLQEALHQAGIPAGSYTGHSFCVGAATTTAQAGISDSLIQKLGRWKSTAFCRYIRPPVDMLVTASSRPIV